MKMPFIIIIFPSYLYASLGFDLFLQKPFNATGNWPAINVSIIKTASRPPLYFSSGIVLRPGDPLGPEVDNDSSDQIRKAHSFFGFFAGTHFAISPDDFYIWKIGDLDGSKYPIYG